MQLISEIVESHGNDSFKTEVLPDGGADCCV